MLHSKSLTPKYETFAKWARNSASTPRSNYPTLLVDIWYRSPAPELWRKCSRVTFIRKRLAHPMLFQLICPEIILKGTDGTLSIPTVTSFFRDQRFPPHWYRRSSPANASLVGATANDIQSAHPVSPGANDANGSYVDDPAPSDPVSGFYCSVKDCMLMLSTDDACRIARIT